MGGGNKTMKPIVSKLFCSSMQSVLMVRKRPHVVNGGGFVVSNASHEVVFAVDGCGILGTKGELVVRDGYGASILYIRKRGGLVQALSAGNKWNGYLMEFEGPSKLVFSLTDPKSCLMMNGAIRISIEPKGRNKDWDFEVRGSFAEKDCTVTDRQGNVVVKVGVKEMMSRDFYNLVVQPGYDQAFVVGVIAVLDNIHGESTRC